MTQRRSMDGSADFRLVALATGKIGRSLISKLAAGIGRRRSYAFHAV